MAEALEVALVESVGVRPCWTHMKKAQHLRVGPFTTVRWKEASNLKAWWTLETARQLEGSTSFAPQEQQGQPAY